LFTSSKTFYEEAALDDFDHAFVLDDSEFVLFIASFAVSRFVFLIETLRRLNTTSSVTSFLKFRLSSFLSSIAPGHCYCLS